MRKYLPKKLAAEGSESKILDAGCGLGRVTALLAELFPKSNISAVDIKQSPEWDVRQLGNRVTFGELDLHTYDELNERDLTVSIDVLEHILDNKSVLARLCKGIKPEGYFFLTVPCKTTGPFILPEKWFARFLEWEEKEHIGDQLLLNEWCELIKSHGLEIETSRYTFTYWGRFAWETEYLLRGKKWGRRINLLLTPIYRLFAFLDVYAPLGKGNNLIVAKKLSDA